MATRRRRGPVPHREMEMLRFIGTSTSSRMWCITMTDEAMRLASNLGERGLVGFVPHSTRSLKGSDAILTNAGRALLLASAALTPIQREYVENTRVFEDPAVAKWP